MSNPYGTNTPIDLELLQKAFFETEATISVEDANTGARTAFSICNLCHTPVVTSRQSIHIRSIHQTTNHAPLPNPHAPTHTAEDIRSLAEQVEYRKGDYITALDTLTSIALKTVTP